MHVLNIHGVHHAEFFLFIALVLLLLYFPPPTTPRIFSFIDVHYRDSFGIGLLLLGISLIFIGDVWPSMSHIAEAGNALMLAAMGFLNLTKSVTNGNGHGNGANSPPAAGTSPPGAPQ